MTARRLVVSRRFLLAPALIALANACASSGPPAAAPSAPPPATAAPVAATAPSDPRDELLPPTLRDLDLTEAQRADILRTYADLESSAEPFASAVAEYGRSMAGAVRQCKGTTPFMEMDGERLVRQGEDLRGPLLDAAQHLHRVLTPAQRKKLSDRLVEGDDWAKRERRNAARTKDLGPMLDLSTMQVMQMLVKAGVLWSSFADKADPWRVRYRTAITNFARDDFDVHAEPVATAPLAALTLEFARTGLRMLLPLLEPKQCEALGNLIDQKVDEQVARRATAAAARAKALSPR
jgi:Spy/CpxP family protein refolding chaperone